MNERFQRPHVDELRAEAFAGGHQVRSAVLDTVYTEKDRLLAHIQAEPIIDADTIASEQPRPAALIEQGLTRPYRYIGVVEAETPNTAEELITMFGDSPFIAPWRDQESGHGRMYQYKSGVIDDIPLEVPELTISATARIVGRAQTIAPFFGQSFDYTRTIIGRFNERCNAVTQGMVRLRERATGHDVFARATGHAVRQELLHADWYDLEALERELTLHPLQLLIGREAALRNFQLVGAFTEERQSLCADMLGDIAAGDIDTLLGRVEGAKLQLISGLQPLVSDGPGARVVKYALRSLGREKSYEAAVDAALQASKEQVE